MLRRCVCLVLGHGSLTLHQDGKGAAWHTCDRCGKVVGSFSWHEAKPWEIR